MIAIRLRRADVGDRYGIKPGTVTKEVTRGSLPRPDRSTPQRRLADFPEHSDLVIG